MLNKRFIHEDKELFKEQVRMVERSKALRSGPLLGPWVWIPLLTIRTFAFNVEDSIHSFQCSAFNI